MENRDLFFGVKSNSSNTGTLIFNSSPEDSNKPLNPTLIRLRFRNSGLKYRGVPVMAANMDTTGTFSIARAFSPHKMFVCIHKHYSVQQWVEFAANNPDCIEVSFKVLEFKSFRALEV